MSSFVRTFGLGATDTTLIGMSLRAFSTDRLVDTDVGDLSCVLGADATCEAGVTKSSSTCALCP